MNINHGLLFGALITFVYVILQIPLCIKMVHVCPWSTKAVISSTAVAIANNTLYGSKLYILIVCQK